MTGSVLVIDDEVTLGRNIKSYLTRHGYDVRHAATGREARELPCRDHLTSGSH